MPLYNVIETGCAVNEQDKIEDTKEFSGRLTRLYAQQSMWAEREWQNSRSADQGDFYNPAHRSVPAPQSPRSRSSPAHPVSAAPAHRSIPAHMIFGPLRSRSAVLAVAYWQCQYCFD